MPFGNPAQPQLVNRGNGGSFAQNQPMRPQMNQLRTQMNRPSVGGVNRPKLGAGGPRPRPAAQTQPLQPAQGLVPRTPSAGGLQDVASRVNQERLIPSETAEGPAGQGYGQNAYASAPSVPKIEPTGGVQMGAANVVGRAPIAPTNPQELMARQTPQMPIDVPPVGPSMLEQQIMASKPDAVMDAVSAGGIGPSIPDAGFRPKREMNPDLLNQINQSVQTGIGPSRRMMRRR